MSNKRDKHKVLFFTGNEISEIKNKQYIKDRLTRRFADEHPVEYMNTIRELVYECESIKPNAIHKMIASTDIPVITTSIDGLQKVAGSTDVIAVHGELPTKRNVDSYLENIKSSDLILYGDYAPKYGKAIELARKLKYGNSYLIVVGEKLSSPLGNILKLIAEKRLVSIIEVNVDIQKNLAEVCEQLSIAGLC